MKVFNTLSRRKEELNPIIKNEYKIYVCGPTVYNYIHVGNARPVVSFDVLRRYLEYKGNRVNFVQNFTDIDDKLIFEAQATGETVKSLAEKFILEYQKDSDGLNVKRPSSSPKATENIQQIISMVKILVDKDFAYEVDGDVYFRTNRFKEYGKLSHQPLEGLMSGIRIDMGDIKEEPTDFALWKASKEGEPSWLSPWGKGRPGWHIECSAMAKRYLGDSIDIHCGGQDLIFPHHENEIAQSESANEKSFANYFMHNSYLNIDNKKMSKSDGNYFTLREVSDKYGYEPIRFLLATSHYRSPLNYSEEIIKQSVATLERLYTFRENLDFWKKNTKVINNTGYEKNLNEYKNKFIESMEDDLNTSEAMGHIFEMIKELNVRVKNEDYLSEDEYNKVSAVFDSLVSGILGLLYNKKDDNLEKEIEDLIEKRQQAREAKDFSLADEIRGRLSEMGIKLEDTPQGVKWSR